MTVSELLSRLTGAYPGATAEALASFKPVFHAHLRKHEGPALDAAYVDVLGTFKPTMRQPFPIPADFLRHLPVGHPKLDGKEKPIDLAGRRDRMLRLMANWRADQGVRFSMGVPEVMVALEFVAGPLAGILAWNDNPQPLLLKRDEIRLAWRRAISQQRRVEYGPPSGDADIWWEQVSGIAQRWGIETAREEWTAKERQTRALPAKPQGPRPPFVPDTSPAALRTTRLAKEFRAKQDEERRPKPEA